MIVNERGVSPVVGVILMVAITVVLAAVVGAIVLGLGGETTEPASAGFDLSKDIRTSGPNAGDLDTQIQVVSISRADAIWVEVDGDPAIWGYDPNKGVSSSDVSADDVGPTGTPQAYLLAENGAGGVGNVVTVGYKESVTIRIIGSYDGEATVLKTYETDAP